MAIVDVGNPGAGGTGAKTEGANAGGNVFHLPKKVHSQALAALIAQPCWVVWKYEPDAKGKPTKVPYQPHNRGLKASTSKASTWATYAEAVAAAKDFDGIGFVLTNTDVVAFDIDNCRDKETGVIDQWALDKVAQGNTYTEITVSGTGLRVIGSGTGEHVHSKQQVANGVSCETYRKATRYITVSANQLPGTPDTLANLDALIDSTVAELEAKKVVPFVAPHSAPQGNPHSTPSDLFDSLPAGLKKQIAAEPYPGEDKSETAASVVSQLFAKAYTDEQIETLFHAYPKGIGKRYAEGKDLKVDIERLRKRFSPQQPTEPQTTTQPITATPYIYRDPKKLPRREFLYGKHLVRKFLSGKVAQGATGKSTLVVAETLSMTSGRALVSVIPHGRLRVWLWNLEDPKEETERKIQAAALHYNLSADDLEGYLFVDSGREQKLVIAETTRDGAKIIRPVVDSLIQEIISRKIDVLIIDPFISSHRVVENTADMDLVVKQWSEVAELGNCAVELVHHTRKGELEKTVESARGSGSITDACRSVEVLNRMTKEEAKQAGVKNHRLYFRVYDDKPNLAPPKETSNWYKLENVDLGNGPLADGAGGDEVGVAITWQWPDFMAGITGADFEKVAAVIRAGKFRKSSQANDWVGKAVAKALNLSVKEDRAKIVALLKVWMDAETLVEVPGLDAKSKPREFIEVAEID
jgi:hypothetical protein